MMLLASDLCVGIHEKRLGRLGAYIDYRETDHRARDNRPYTGRGCVQIQTLQKSRLNLPKYPN